MDGHSLRVLRAEDVAGLRAEARRAAQEGMEAVLLGEGPLGDPFVLLAALSDDVPGLLLGAQVILGTGTDGKRRHPALLAREATSLDLVCGGRTLLCFAPPFGDGLEEAIGLCRAMWRDGTATSEGPVYPVAGALNRPRPAREDSPLLALDLTEPGARDEAGGRAALADMVVVSGEEGEGSGSVCRLERVRA
ncbi:MAG TPA: LLM class flavin-dependent oxidoreductase [Acidimicrobiales bacterium]|nr:LLM class flavin-dependent oxidoreductase [Acidimicrobiales bacterium]